MDRAASWRAGSPPEGARVVSAGVIPDACDRVSHAQRGVRRRHCDFGLAQSVRRQRHQDLFRARREARRGARSGDRSAWSPTRSWTVTPATPADVEPSDLSCAALRRITCGRSSRDAGPSGGQPPRRRLRQRRHGHDRARAVSSIWVRRRRDRRSARTAATSTCTAARRISSCCRRQWSSTARAAGRGVRRRRRSRALRRSPRQRSSMATRCC